MFSVANLLDRAKAAARIESDYRLAKIIGINQSALGNYRAGRSFPNDQILSQLCALSGDDPGIIAAQIQAEKSPTEAGKNLWMTIAKRLAGGASTAILSVVFAIVLIASFPGPVLAADALDRAQATVNFLYIVSTRVFVRCYWFAVVRLRQLVALARLAALAAA